MKLLCLGQMELAYGFRRLKSPLYTLMDEDTPNAGIQPVYRMNSDISQGWLRRLIDEALATAPAPLDPLPAELRARNDLYAQRFALAEIHHPQSMESQAAARRRLAFDEVFLLQLYLLRRRALHAATEDSGAQHQFVIDGPLIRALPALLPFELTADQQQAVAELLSDLAQPRAMSRLLMGDVGSGKTVVALHCLLAAIDSGKQAAMMAPTAVLASQYALKLGPLLDQLQVKWALLTSDTPTSDRTEMLAALASDDPFIVFGTHALIEADVVFSNLALVVIDEQHRFGVAQRDALRAKGQNPHYLAMTATPIPRSLALTIYGDQDICYLKSRPRSDAKITTKVLSRKRIAVAYAAVAKALERGEQAYIVCPLIGSTASTGSAKKSASSRSKGDEAEQISLEQSAAEDALPELLTEFSAEGMDTDLRAAEAERDFLAREVFPQRRVELLTSRLPSIEKTRIMAAFRAGQIDILVSTTVIEVGVDVANATVMIIQDAERFGLSQLHQLRGRVGRGSRDGEVFLISNSESKEARERLSILENCSDGFQLAEEDLRLRREGDVIGLRQHGLASLKLIQVIRDSELIELARKEAEQLLADDPELAAPELSLLARRLQQFEAKAKSDDQT